MPSRDLRALVVDDEAPARAALRHRLSALEGVEVVGEASNGRQALEAVEELTPEVLFLDIEMAEGDGFHVVDGLPEDDTPAVVFVTAYDRYAVAAFQAHALDYVLKPASRKRLADVVARVAERRELEREAEEHRRLLARIAAMREDLGERRPAAGSAPRAPGEPGPHAGGAPTPGVHGPPPDGDGPAASGSGPPAGGKGQRIDVSAGRIVVKRRGEYVLVPLDEIRWLEAAGNYVRIHAADGSFLHRTSLAALEERLPGDRFTRVHRSAIVSLAQIDRVVPNESGDFAVHLSDGDVVKMSRSYRDRLLD